MTILAVVLATAALFAACFLGYCAMRNKARFKLSATLAKWFSFHVEVEPTGQRESISGPPKQD